MAAYCDRPTERERDLEDIAHLLDAYVDDDDDRRFDEGAGRDFDLVPAYLLGRDVGAVATSGAHRRLIARFLDLVGDPDAVGHSLMQRAGPDRRRTDDTFLRRCLDAFQAGLAATGAATGTST